MATNATPQTRDWGLYGAIAGGIGLLALLVFAEGRAIRAEQRAEAVRAEQRAEVARAEQRAEAVRAEQREEVARAEQRAEAEATRRYVAEAIARANELAAVNSIRIDLLNEAVEQPSDSPPSN